MAHLNKILAIGVMACAWVFLGSAARAQEGGFIRVVTSSGHQMAGESIDPEYPGWIPFRSANMPTQWEMEGADSNASTAPASANSKGDTAHATATAVHRPVVVVKYRDKSSLPLLGAMTSHQVLTEVDVVFIGADGKPDRRYKLSDASVISIRAGGVTEDGDSPMEQVRLNYEKIELVK